MARRIEATITGFANASRQFRTTDVTLTDVNLVVAGGLTEILPTVKTDLAVVRDLRLPATGSLYLSEVPGTVPMLFGLRVHDHTPVFVSGAGFDAQLANLFLLVLGLAFFWTGIGAYFAWIMWKQRRVFADAKHARRLFEAGATG